MRTPFQEKTIYSCLVLYEKTCYDEGMAIRLNKIICSACALSLLYSGKAFAVPTAAIWSGSGADNNTATAGNWVSPPGVPTSDPGTSLTFPSIPATPHYTVINNLAPPPFQIGALSISGNPAGTPTYNISTPFPPNTFLWLFAGAGTGSITVTGIDSALQTNTLNVPIETILAPSSLEITSVNGIFAFTSNFLGTGNIVFHGNGSAAHPNPGIIFLLNGNGLVSGNMSLVDSVILRFNQSDFMGSGSVFFDNGTTTAGGVLQPTSSGMTITRPIQTTGPAPIAFDLSQIPGGTLTVSALSLLNNPSIIASGNGILNIANTITGSSSLTLNSNVTVQLTGGGPSTYSGPTTINSGTLQPSGAPELSANSVITLANNPSAVLDLTLAATEVIGGLTGTGPGGTVILGNQPLQIGGPASNTYGGAIVSGPGVTTSNLVINKPGAVFTLTGSNNTYSGGTGITAGTLQAGAANAFSPNAFISVNPGAILDLNNQNNTITYLTNAGTTLLGSGTLTLTLPSPGTSYGGMITGTGGITINSPTGQTWSLTTPGNNYSGATTVLSGTLQASAAPNVFSPNSIVVLANNSLAFLDLNNLNNQIAGLSGGGSSGGNVTLGTAALTIQGPSSTSYGGAISGTGAVGVILNGGGTLQLTGGSNTYSGTTTVNASTLQAGATNALPTFSDVTLTGGALNLNNFSNTIKSLSGSGTVSLGSGTLSLVGYTGPKIFSGAITGSGGLTLNGNGIFRLTGTSNTYSGPTTILSGALQSGAVNAFSPNSLVTLANNNGAILDLNSFNNTIGGLAGGGSIGGDVLLNAATLTIQGSNSTIYSGRIFQAGNLILNGPGTLFLNGANTYTGTTTVNAGATFGGLGSVTSNVFMFGTMSPGNSIGTFTIFGTYTQEPGSSFLCEINPTASDKLIVSGAVTIDPGTTFNVSPDPGVYAQNQTYTVITGVPVSGTYTTVTSTSILLPATLSYPGNAVVLNLQPQTIASIATQGNPHKVAVALDTILSSGSSAVNAILADIFFLSAPEMIHALDQMHPAQLKAQTLIQENNAIKVRDSLLNHLRLPIYEDHCSAYGQKYAEPEHESFTLWMEGLGDWLRQDSTHYAASHQVGYTDFMAGVVLGADIRFADLFSAGLLGGYTHSDTHWVHDHGHGTVQSEYLGAYFTVSDEWFYAALSGIGAWNDYHSTRNIIFPGVDAAAKGKTKGHQFITSLDAGLILPWIGLAFSPYDTLDYIAQTEGAFTETHAGVFDLKVNKSLSHMVRNELGLNISRCECSHGIRWIFDAKIGWVREVRLHAEHFTSKFKGTDVPFTVTGYMPSRNLVSPGASITALIYKHDLSCNIYYNGLYGHKFSDSSIGAGLTYYY